MPVKHDLFKDLNITKEEISKRSSTDHKLSKLLEDYNSIDADVVEAESGAPGITDDQLKKFKEKRLLVKDKIVQRLTAPD